jgi:hypothetical protein
MWLLNDRSRVNGPLGQIFAFSVWQYDIVTLRYDEIKFNISDANSFVHGCQKLVLRVYATRKFWKLTKHKLLFLLFFISKIIRQLLSWFLKLQLPYCIYMYTAAIVNPVVGSRGFSFVNRLVVEDAMATINVTANIHVPVISVIKIQMNLDQVFRRLICIIIMAATQK